MRGGGGSVGTWKRVGDSWVQGDSCLRWGGGGGAGSCGGTGGAFMVNLFGAPKIDTTNSF